MFNGSNPLRRWILRLHMCCGLLLSIYAVLVGVSGSILVFRPELNRLARPELYRGRPLAGLATSPDQVLALARQSYPEWRPLSLTWPDEDSPSWMLYLLRGNSALELYVDPGFGAVTGTRDPSDGWLGWVGRLHVSMLAGSAGRLVNGYGALGLIGLSVTGVLLWWPGRWWSRDLARGLHYAAGIIVALFIALLGATGAYFVWPDAYIDTANRLFERAQAPSPLTSADSAAALSLRELTGRAQAIFPGRALSRMELSGSPAQPVRVVFREGAAYEFHRISSVTLNPFTGGVMAKTPLEDRPAGDSLLAWLSVLHFGVFAGLPGRVAWAVLGLSLPLMSITGFLMWWRRIIVPGMRKTRLRKKRREESPSEVSL